MPEEIYSPGLEGVIAGETAISTVTGGLSYRGYSIEELARHGTFEEVAYLLLYGELPKPSELDDFQQAARCRGRKCQRRSSTRSANSRRQRLPMDVLRSACQHARPLGSRISDNSHDANVRKAERLLAQLPS